MPTGPSSRQGDAAYGWVVVAVSVAVGAVAWGIPNSFGVFFKPIQADLQGSRALLSGAVSLYIFVHGAVAVLWGWCSDRYGIRLVVAAGGFLTVLGALLTSSIQELWQLYVAYGVVFAVGAGAMYVPLMSNASGWFERRRGLALGMVASGAGVGTIFFPSAVDYLIWAYGWRAAFVVMAAVCAVVIGAAIPFLRPGPRRGSPAPGARGPAPDQPEAAQMRLGQALRRRPFWVIFVMYFFAFICLHMVYVHLVPRATDAGVPSSTAAILVSLVGGFSIVGKLAGGSAADRIGPRRAFLVVMSLQVLGFLWLLVSRETWMFVLFAIAFGLAYGGWMPLIPALAVEHFGARHLGTVFGALTLAAAMGGTVGPALAGYVFDVTASYSTAFVAAAAASLLALGLAAGALREGFGLSARPPASGTKRPHGPGAPL